MMAPQDIRLTVAEFRRCFFVGFCRNLRAIDDGYKDQHGFNGDALQIHVLGCYGENAFCNLIGERWEGQVDRYSDPDHGHNVQVRTRSSEYMDLLVRPRDRKNAAHRFVHITAGEDRWFRIHGWLFGHEAMRDEYLQTYGNRPPAWFIPTEQLNKNLEGFFK